MLTTILIFINILIFFLLSGIHWYWAANGTWGVDYTVPKKFREKYWDPKYRTSTIIATIVVAIGLLAMAGVIASNHFDFTAWLPGKWTIYLTRAIGAVFIIRAVGDFNFVGMFKKKSDDIFAIKDSQIYVPLCLYLGVSSILISIW